MGVAKLFGLASNTGSSFLTERVYDSVIVSTWFCPCVGSSIHGLLLSIHGLLLSMYWALTGNTQALTEHTWALTGNTWALTEHTWALTGHTWSEADERLVTMLQPSWCVYVVICAKCLQP